MRIPRSHPRYRSLATRDRLARAVEAGLAVREGLIAHGRGEAFDYLLGERSTAFALRAEKCAAAHLLKAERPVISVNGNTAALAAKEAVALARGVGAALEANVFYGNRKKRAALIIRELERSGAHQVLGLRPDARIPGLEGQRALCSREGIHSADVVLVPLEDGDRTRALAAMGKTVISVDLNPLSRTSMAAHVSIVDELTRALPRIAGFAGRLRRRPSSIARVIRDFDNEKNLSSTVRFIGRRLGGL